MDGENQERPNEVELLLDSQAPQMKERFELGGLVEIAHFAPRNQVGNKGGASGDVLSELSEIGWKKPKPTDAEACHQDQAERGQDAPDAPRVELREAELAFLQPALDEARDQETGDDKKDVDADEPAGNAVRESVEAEDQ